MFGRSSKESPAEKAERLSEKRKERIDKELEEVNKKLDLDKAASKKTRQGSAEYKRLVASSISLIKQRKVLESQLADLNRTRFKMSQLKDMTEKAELSKTMFKAMKDSTSQLKKGYSDIDPDTIEDVHDDLCFLSDLGADLDKVLTEEIDQGASSLTFYEEQLAEAEAEEFLETPKAATKSRIGDKIPGPLMFIPQ